MIPTTHLLSNSQVIDALNSGHVFVSLNAEKLYLMRTGALPPQLPTHAFFTVDGKGGELFARLGMRRHDVRKLNLPDFILSSPWIANKEILLIGGTASANSSAVDRLRKQGLIANGIDGYRPHEEYEAMLRATAASVVFLGMGSPLQEVLALRLHALRPSVPIVCCGGAINTMAGLVAKCPPALDALYLEWAYRLVQNPARLNRMHRLLSLPMAIFAQRRRAWHA